MHFALAAIRTSVDEFREAFTDTWADFEVVASENRFSDKDAVWAWTKENEQFVSAADWTQDNPGTQTCVLAQDGPWALLMDPSFALATDEDALLELSERFGTVLSFAVQTTGGCALFWCYENGLLRRMISMADGPTETEGTPLPEEEGIDVDHYYMDETEALMRAFGLSPIEDFPDTASAVALAVADRTDYDELEAKTGDAGSSINVQNPDPGPIEKPKPWWKFW